MIFLRHILLFILFVAGALNVVAQDRPIGYWRSHLPYGSVIGVAADGSNMYAIGTKAFFTLRGDDLKAGPTTYSKVEGMADIGMQSVAYDATTGTTVFVYSNGNIDLFKEKENTFYNIPDFKIKGISGTKSVSGVFAENGMAYVSTSIGILVIDLATHNIEETYKFIANNETIPINGFIRNGDFFYAFTKGGVYKAPITSPQLQNFQIWQLIDTSPLYTYMASVGNRLYAGNQSSVYTLEHDTFRVVYTCDTNRIITHLDAGKSRLLICEYKGKTFSGAVKLMDLNNVVIDSFYKGILNPRQAVQIADSSYWIADAFVGLQQLSPGGASNFIPAGPPDEGCSDIYAHNKDFWVTHGGYSDRLFPLTSFGGVSNFYADRWKTYRQSTYAPLAGMDYFVAVTKDEKTGTVYFGSFMNGLFTLNADGTSEALNTNSIFDTSSVNFGNNQRQLAGLALDKRGNLWVTSVFSYHQLYAKTAGGWYKFRVPGKVSAGPVVIDDNGQIWFVSLDGGGVVVYDPAGTIEDASDDTYYSLGAGAGSGNLPSNNAFCIAKDNNDNIWVGTDNGIGIISNCNAPGPCDGQIPIVQYDDFAGYLFAGNNVRTIAVDGGNRKWVGTDDGVWLLSPDAQQIIYRFTAENSPLPSNNIRKISIDKVTGDVYIGTLNGLVSFRSTAIEGGESNKDVKIFPNPVNRDYTGTIAIKGLATNADVRITDISGQLVYRTKAFGGQAVWDGRDYKGRKPQSGVYLVFVSSSDGEQTYSGKIVFMQ